MPDIMLDQGIYAELAAVEDSGGALRMTKPLPGPHMNSLPASVAFGQAFDDVWEVIKLYQQLLEKDVEEMRSFADEMNQLDNS